MLTKYWTILWLAALLLAGCATPLVDEPPVEQEPEVEPGSAAVMGLIEQSRMAFGHGDYQAAIANAERGLRIDRREPELYLLLAQSYMALAQPEQAEQFARQGLRYSAPDSLVAQALEAVHEQLYSSEPSLRF